MKPHYKIEQNLWRAVECLATTPETIKYRLERAEEYHLSYVDPSKMPTEYTRTRLLEIQNQLTKNQTQSVKKTIEKWRISKCHTIAGDICNIYYTYANFEWHLYPAGIPPVSMVSEYEQEK